ncbi:S8 family serine peptidase [Flavobacterium rhizosphaerae]|uniref:S8 family serine peptidase n=1 Tax=Flavobacterium rhizosphaerae TaxID=3163298 RepID=A0ABW8YWE0_9FLAO
MYDRVLYIAALFISLAAYAQEDAWVYFKDKPEAAFYLANPLEMLTQKAIDRREKQHIALDEKDVPISPTYIHSVIAANGITVMAKSKWLNALHVRGTQGDIQTLTSLVFIDRVDFANTSLNASGRQKKRKAEKVPQAQRTAQEFNYGGAATQIQLLNGQLLHQQNFTGTGMTIAVLDGGFPGVDTAQPFERLRNNGQILGGYNFVGHSPDFYTSGSHGAMVLSDIGGFTEGKLVGTAPDAYYYLFITEDVTSENPVEESYWVQAAEVADSLGVDVINTSLGYFDYDNPAYNYTYEDIDGKTAFITRGANVAFTRGMLCVTSAGNSGITSHPHIGVPADAVNTLTVGAVDSAEIVTSFSSRGPTYDQRIKPDVMAMGYQAVVANPEGNIITANGTSFSSPITAGLVACLWQALPNLDNAQILQLIKQSADRYENPDTDYGYGIPDFWLAYKNGKKLQQAMQKFILYPSPVPDAVTISIPNGIENAMVIFYNSLGQVVVQKEITPDNAVIAVQQLPPGVYGYRIECSGKLQWGRLLKQ